MSLGGLPHRSADIVEVVVHYPDLSPYGYLGHAEANVFNVGWLDGAHPFPTGGVPQKDLETLLDLTRKPVNRTRGWHRCEICGAAPPIIVGQGERAVRLGDAEIRAVGCDGRTYAAPNLIYHYVERHHYRPPDEFLKALTCTSTAEQP